MPKVSVNENCDFLFVENEIWLADELTAATPSMYLIPAQDAHEAEFRRAITSASDA